MTRYTPLWLQQGNYPAAVDRALPGALWPTGGVTGMVVTASAAMTLNISPGRAAVPTQNNTGSTLCWSDAVEQVTLTAAPPSGQSRIDVITVHPRGNDLDGGANNDWIFDVVVGTAAPAPTAPTVPAGQLAVAQVTAVGGSASIAPANIVDRRNGPLTVPKPALCKVQSPTLMGNVITGTFTKLPWTAVAYDPLGMSNIATGDITIPAGFGGLWHLDLNVGFQGQNTPGTLRYVDVFLNGGATSPIIAGNATQAGASGMQAVASADLLLNAGDVLYARGYQNGTGGLQVYGYFNLRRVADTPGT